MTQSLLCMPYGLKLSNSGLGNKKKTLIYLSNVTNSQDTRAPMSDPARLQPQAD